MKHLAHILSLFVLVSAGLFFSSCGGNDPSSTSEEETQLNKFKFTWNISSVTLAGATTPNKTSEYPGMTTTFSGTFSAGGNYNYTSTATSWPSVSPWKANDTWKFKSSSIGNTIVRSDDGQEMGYSFSTDGKTLTINIDNYTGTGYNNGRVTSVLGDWTFVFTRP